MQRETRHPPHPSGFTLIEMLLVLALLVSLLLMTYPTLNRLHLEHQLKQGAEQVRLQLTSARLHALQSGIDYQFRYEPGGKRFVALPADYQAIQTQAAATQNNAGGASVIVYWKTQGEFKVKVSFSAQTAPQFGNPQLPPQPLPAEFLTGFENSAQLAGIAWSSPLVFKPDGSAQDFTVEIEHESGAYVILEVRGITGGTNVTPIKRRVRA